MTREQWLAVCGVLFVASVVMIVVAIVMCASQKTRIAGAMIGIVGGSLMTLSAKLTKLQ